MSKFYFAAEIELQREAVAVPLGYATFDEYFAMLSRNRWHNINNRIKKDGLRMEVCFHTDAAEKIAILN